MAQAVADDRRAGRIRRRSDRGRWVQVAAVALLWLARPALAIEFGMVRVQQNSTANTSAAVTLTAWADATALLAVDEQVEVAATDAAGEHPGEHLAGAGHGVGQVVDPQLPVTHHSSTHGATVPTPWAPGSDRRAAQVPQKVTYGPLPSGAGRV